MGLYQYAHFLGVAVPGFLLIFARCVGLTLQAPIFGSRAVPATIRVGLAFALALVWWVAQPVAPQAPVEFLPYVLVIMAEVVFGAMLGYAASIVHFAIQGAGDFAAQAIGLTMISTMNPMIRTNSTPTGQIFYYLALTVFCTMGGHLMLLGAFYQSFDLVPLGGFAMNAALWGVLSSITGGLLGIVLQLAMPPMIVMLLIDISLGVINRSTPQAQNLLDFVSTLKPGLGLVIVTLMLPNLMAGIHFYSEQMILDVQKAIATQTPKKPSP